jgi:heme exporter protein D
MSAHAVYVASAYGISALVVAAMVAWVLVDQRGRKRELAVLEASGIRRRSEAGPAA